MDKPSCENTVVTMTVRQSTELPFCRSTVGKKMELALLINGSDKPIVITVKGTPLGYAIPANGRFPCVLCQGEFVQSAHEFMIRFWIVYVWQYMRSCCRNESLKRMSEHREWVIHYLELLKKEKGIPDFINMTGKIEIPY